MPSAYWARHNCSLHRFWAAGVLVLFAWLSVSPALAQSVQTGVFEFSNWDGSVLPVHYAEPDNLSPDAPIVIVMHGVNRNADDYRDNWVELADQYGFAVYAPEFSKVDFPKSKNYNLGGLSNAEGRAFDAIEPLFDQIKARRGVDNPKYYLFGHSAGAQFVHRYVYFNPDARYEQAYAANAGWYTLPDVSWDWPYGLKNAPAEPMTMPDILSRDLVLLLGDQDIDPTSHNLRQTPEAKAQGQHRLERGLNFLKVAKAQADSLGVPAKWTFQIIPDVAHDNHGMAIAAAAQIHFHHNDKG